MGDQLTTSAEALRLFFNEDIYLVSTPDVTPAVSLPEVKAAVPRVFKSLGKNEKNILILVNDANNDVSTEKGRELLRNIVKALQLTANDFALLNYITYENATFSELTSFFSSKLSLVFGVAPVQLGLGEHAHHVVHLVGTTQLIFSGNLDTLADDLQGKKTLWGSLKQLSI
ncbi:hypothetical protein [Pedobacter sp. L105]|uniref:hypothetical protein n=1 Tax=Pedobacter sp. L105 TaxID=1641871 RepID=UPI00131E8017|nr:hypothetical protein [Pedobacter sp. L105]